MARTKVQIETSELQDAINQLEAERLFGSPHKLYEAIAETPWARTLGATMVMIYLKVKEVNSDPDNPGITMKVKPARRVGSRGQGDQGGDGQTKTRRTKVKGVTFDGLDLLLEAFRGRGIEVIGVEKLITSSQKPPEENRAIMLAWADIRDKLGIPKPIKKTVGPVNQDLVQDVVLPTVEELVAKEPTGAEFVEMGLAVEEPIIEVTEQMPDGAPVLSQEAANIGSESEPESGVVPVVAKPVPMSVQKVAVRPPMSRPSPVNLVVPPRPMPVN